MSPGMRSRRSDSGHTNAACRRAPMLLLSPECGPRRRHTAGQLAKPKPCVQASRRRIASPNQNARTLPRKQIHWLMPVIDRPHQRPIEPLTPGRSRRRNSHWAGDEHVDVRIVAEVKQAQAGALQSAILRLVVAWASSSAHDAPTDARLRSCSRRDQGRKRHSR